MRVGQHCANVLVDTARLSGHRPVSLEQEQADLIYSTPPVFSARFEVRLAIGAKAALPCSGSCTQGSCSLSSEA